MTEKTKAIIILIAVVIAYALYLGTTRDIPWGYLTGYHLLPPPLLHKFQNSISILGLAISHTLFLVFLIGATNSIIGVECTNGKFHYSIDKFFYIALALGILAISKKLIFSHLPHWESRDIADLIASQLMCIAIFPIFRELFCRHWAITFLENYDFKPRTICITSVTLDYATNHLYLLLETEPNWGYESLDAIYYIASGIVLYKLYTRTRDVRHCIIMQMIITTTGAVITAFHSFLLPHFY